MKRDFDNQESLGSQSFTRHNSAEWIQSGNGYFDRLEKLIDDAKSEIHFQTYIFLSDETGLRISNALIRAAKRNIKIFLLVDAFGSQALSSEQIIRMTEAGILFRKFGVLYSKGSFHISRRMHHKVIVIDGLISIVGGMNVSNNYNDIERDYAWLDFAAIMKGEVSRQLLSICRKRWDRWNLTKSFKKKSIPVKGISPSEIGQSRIAVTRNDFVRNKNDIAITYRDIFRFANKSIVVVGGYFLPGGRTRRLMKNAIKSGVTIKVILSEKSDVKIFIRARKYLYAWLIRNGVRVFVYNPSNVHGKVIICDNELTSIGSFDLNNLSTYSNIELNVNIHDEKFSSGLTSNIDRIIEKDCFELNSENMYKHTTIFGKFFMWFSYRFVKTLFVLGVVLAGKKEKTF